MRVAPSAGGGKVSDELELKSCPFCGWPDPSWEIERHAYDFIEYAAHCGNCNARGAIADTKQGAANAWNIRYPAPQAQPLVMPDWSTAPEWAMYHVYNCVAMGLWTKNECEVDRTWASGWKNTIPPLPINGDYSGYELPLGLDWRTTLTPRHQSQRQAPQQRWSQGDRAKAQILYAQTW